MTVPAVNITELDGALGILPPTDGALYTVVGVTEKGPVDTPATYARVSDLVADFGQGPAVEAAAYYIVNYGDPVVIVRTGATTIPTATTVVFTGTGTSVITADLAATDPLDYYEVYLLVTTGGTIGTGPIVFQWSLDGGRTLSPRTDLGTANTFAIPDSGVTIDFAAGDLVAGDTATFNTTPGQYNSSELTSALTALGNSLLNWEFVHVVGDIDATLGPVIDTAVGGLTGQGKFKAWVGNTRMPNIAETEAAYLSSLSGSITRTVLGQLCAGAAKLVSGVSGRSYRRHVSFISAARHASVSQEVNVADVNLGPLPGVTIRDSNGNPDEHDESINPGLDDAGFTVLRTWDSIQGVYINRPLVYSPDGSDFELFPHRRVLNLAQSVLRPFFIRRLNKSINVDGTTGFILEEDAEEIEQSALRVLESSLSDVGKASDVQFVLSRTDNLLSTKTLTGTARVVPLAYPEFIDLEVGFLNPALQVVTV